jgi:hypothetical protein
MGRAEVVFHDAERLTKPMLITALWAGIGPFPATISHGIGG